MATHSHLRARDGMHELRPVLRNPRVLGVLADHKASDVLERGEEWVSDYIPPEDIDDHKAGDVLDIEEGVSDYI